MPQTNELNHLDPLTGQVHASIPVIYCEDLASGDWDVTVPAALTSMREHGILCLELSQRQQTSLNEALDCMRDFFSRDEDFKSAYRDVNDDYGWTPSKYEPAYQPGTVSNVESYDIIPALIGTKAGPEWPAVPGFRTSAIDYWTECVRLADFVLELVARAADIPEHFLSANCNSQSLNTMRLLHYPPDSVSADANEVGIAAHTDFECITLLYQSAPGLEVRNVNGEWLDAPTVPGRLIVLLGDMLERWTNGYLQATGHRVRRTLEQRYSVVMFVAANEGVRIEPLPRFVGASHPPLYEPTEQGKHIEAEIDRAKSQLEVARK